MNCCCCEFIVSSIKVHRRRKNATNEALIDTVNQVRIFTYQNPGIPRENMSAIINGIDNDGVKSGEGNGGNGEASVGAAKKTHCYTQYSCSSSRNPTNHVLKV